MNRLAALRVDASWQIGHGHLYRCLVLADTLRDHGFECHFLCRPHNGFPASLVLERGHVLHTMPAATGEMPGDAAQDDGWLGVSWQQDANDCIGVLTGLVAKPEWLVVDHYSIDRRWEAAMGGRCGRVLAIDDLADRPHTCSILLDQTLGRRPMDYAALVPASCEVLAGTGFALLQSQYRRHRGESLERRRGHVANNLLVSMGGVDAADATGSVLRSLADGELPPSTRIAVVLGHDAPWCEQVKALARRLPWSVSVHEGVAEMAPLLVATDLAIGAAGGSAWERCCLGVPAIVLVLADNQRAVAEALHREGAAVRVECSGVGAIAELVGGLLASGQRLEAMSARAAELVDGRGADRVVARMLA